MNVPDDFKRDFEALCLDQQPLVMELSKFQAWVVFCHLQLALRHPANQGETSKHARAIAQHLERLLATTPALRRVAEQGWHTEAEQRDRKMATEDRTRAGIEERVGNALVEGAFLTRGQLEAAQAKAKASNRKLSEVLLSDQMVPPGTLTNVLSFQLGVPIIDVQHYPCQQAALRCLPRRQARQYNALPVFLDGDVLRVAVEDPYDNELLGILTALTRKLIKPVVPLRGGLKEAIDANYPRPRRRRPGTSSTGD